MLALSRKRLAHSPTSEPWLGFAGGRVAARARRDSSKKLVDGERKIFGGRHGPVNVDLDQHVVRASAQCMAL